MKIKSTFFLWLCLCCFSCIKSQQFNAEKAQNDPDKTIASQRLDSLDIKNQYISVGANQTSLYLPILAGQNIGLVANQTSVIFKTKRAKTAPTKKSKGIKTEQYTHLVDSLIRLKINLRKVYAPEHGFRGTSDAGETVEDGIDKKTGLPVISLYGKNKKPTSGQLEGIDIMIFDIQDVGVRFYTYISTLHYVMEACAENNIPLIVLDRPNPNGFYIGGPTLQQENSSFLGMHPIPLVHGMTMGEYAKMINGEGWLTNNVTCDLKVILCEGYNRKETCHLPIYPSPNLPNDKAINLYPSLGLFEGTNINAGRGTDYQFQRFGAPFLNPDIYNFTYTPKPNKGAKNPKHNKVLCYGKDLSKTPKLHEINLNWLIEAYENSSDKKKFFKTSSFTLHAGTPVLQKQIEAGLDAKSIKETWKQDLERFKKIRSKYLLYP
jgi:uncharacterized protein YbbC (DUF1343 family)